MDLDLFGGDDSSSDTPTDDGDGGEHGGSNGDNSGRDSDHEEPIKTDQTAVPVAPGRALFVRAVSDDATTEDDAGGGEGKDDTPPAAAGSSRPVKTLPRPAYEGDPLALINVCNHGGSGNVEEARDLIARGININEQNEPKHTALHLATAYGSIDIVQELLRAGAALAVKDVYGKTALQWAQDCGKTDIIALLKEAEAAAAAAAAAAGPVNEEDST